MSDEINDELDLDLEEGKKPRRDQRVDNALSAKQKAEEEAAKAHKAREKAEKEAEAARKDLEFFRNFNTESAGFQGAGEYQEVIREKVNKGYSMKDAIATTLMAEGKYTPPPPPPPTVSSPTGGSAPVNLQPGADKPIMEMSMEEKRAKLLDAEKRGDIALN